MDQIEEFYRDYKTRKSEFYSAVKELEDTKIYILATNNLYH